MLEKYLWNSFLLYLVVEILQLVHEIRCSPSKHLLVLKTSSRRFQDMSWRRLQHVFSVTILRLPRRLEDVLKTCLEDVLKTCLEDVLKTYLEDVSKTCLEEVLKIFWRKTKYLLGISVYLFGDNQSKWVSSKSIFRKSISDKF